MEVRPVPKPRTKLNQPSAHPIPAQRRLDNRDEKTGLQSRSSSEEKKSSLITTTKNMTSKFVRRSMKKEKSVDESESKTSITTEQKKTSNNGIFSSDDFFNSISFHSPLSRDSLSELNPEDTSTRTSPPPPTFPPPELPSSDVYDDVQFNSLDRKFNSLSFNASKTFVPNFPGEFAEKERNSDSSGSIRKTSNSDQSLSSEKSVKNSSADENEEKKCLLDNDEIYSCPSNTNSLYDWKVTSGRRLVLKAELYEKPDKLLLEEFDPLKDDLNPDEDIYENTDAVLLATLLASSKENILYGSEGEDLEENLPYEVSANPPKPPRRFDSLPKHEYDEVEMVEQQEPDLTGRIRLTPSVVDSIRSKTVSDESDKNSESFGSRSVIHRLTHLKRDSASVGTKSSVINLMKNTLMNRSSHVKKSKRASEVCIKLEKPPSFDQCLPVTHRGIIYKTKDLVKRFAYLKQQKIQFFVDQDMTVCKDQAVDLTTVHSVHLLQDVKVVNDEPVHCLAIAGDKNVNVLYIRGITERRIWAQKIIEALTSSLPTRFIAELIRAGWAYLKEGVTGSWFPAWIVLQHRTLIYTKSSDPTEHEQLDLRKARCILLRDDEDAKKEKTSVVLIDIDRGSHGALHLTSSGLCEIPAWRHALYQAATCCGPSLSEQQLTHDNVPVIFDKCINFIYTHGILSEGIYRKGGSSKAVTQLMEDFRKDAWAVQLTRTSYSEHDVATVLRRFIRNIPESLIPSDLHEDFYKVLDICDDEKRVNAYKKLISKLDVVSVNGLKRILAHLFCISQQSSKNLMTIDNLSAIWGPTLMHSGLKKSPKVWDGSESKVIDDLITLYPKLYELSSVELDKEAKIFEILQKHHGLNTAPRTAQSGDLKIWIYLFSRDKESVNVTVGPQKTAGDVCQELAEKVQIPAHKLCLHESTLGGALWRPLHYSENVFDTITRWGYWDPSDRKDNVLILQTDTLYRNIIPNIKKLMTIAGELKYADHKSKHLKAHFFEFTQAKLSCYKDKAYLTKLYEWKIEDIIWYLGHEPKRNPNANWSITFILKSEHPTRSKHGAPYFGNILAGSLDADLYNWMAAFLFGKYQLNILPKEIDLNT